MNTYSQAFDNMLFPTGALPPGMTQKDLEGPDYMDFQERLEYLDNNNGEKQDYMKLIKDIIYDYGISALDTATIENAIYSYSDAR